MANPVLAGSIGVVGITGASVGAYFLIAGLNVHWQPLSKDNPAPTTGYGNTYKDYLTGTDKSNNDWWTLSFDILKSTENITTQKFNDLKTGEGKKWKDLRKACEDAYKAEETNVTEAGSSSDSSKYKTSEVWKFCSPVKTIEETNEVYESGTYGKEYRTKLASLKTNNIFWKQRLEALKQDDLSSVSSTSEFKTIEIEKMTVADLRIKCKEAYRTLTATTSGSFSKEDIFKFCSLLGKEESTTPGGGGA